MLGRRSRQSEDMRPENSPASPDLTSSADLVAQVHPKGPGILPPPAFEIVPTVTSSPMQPGWRDSEGHQQLLLYFASPNAVANLPRSYDWDEILGESVDSAVRRLIRDGALHNAHDVKWRIFYRRGVADLKELCRSHGLKLSGTKEQLAERLAGIDPTGELFGSREALFVCSDEALQFIATNRLSLEIASGDLRELRGLFSLSEFEAEKESLKRRFSDKGFTPPSSDDVKWSLLNKRALQYANEGNLGLCRNTYYAMASFLRRRKKLRQALPLFLLVCAYDLNGASNCGGISGDLLKEFPLFDPRFSSLAPPVVEDVQSIREALSLTLDDVSREFADATKGSNFPVPIERSWSILMRTLERKIDLNQQPQCFDEIRELMDRGDLE